MGDVQYRGAQQGSVNAAVGDGKRAAFEIGQFQSIFLDFIDIIDDGLLEFGKTESVGMTNNRDHQSFFGTDGNTDMIKVMINDFLLINKRIDFWIFFECFACGFNKKGHKSQRNAMFFLEIFLESGTDILNTRHINFIEGRQHGGVLLGFEQPRRNAPPDSAHGFAAGLFFFFPVFVGRFFLLLGGGGRAVFCGLFVRRLFSSTFNV